MKIINLRKTYKYKFETSDNENELFMTLEELADYLTDEHDDIATRKETAILMSYLESLEIDNLLTYHLEVFMEYEDGDVETFFITKLK